MISGNKSTLFGVVSPEWTSYGLTDCTGLGMWVILRVRVIPLPLFPSVLGTFLGKFPSLGFRLSSLIFCLYLITFLGCQLLVGSLPYFKLLHVLNYFGHRLGKRLEVNADHTSSPVGRYHLIQDVNQISFGQRDIRIRSREVLQIVTNFLEPPIACPGGHPYRLVQVLHQVIYLMPSCKVFERQALELI